LVRGDAALDACHRWLLEVRQQPAQRVLGLGAQDRLAPVPTCSARGLDLEVVAAPRLHAKELAAAGHADALLGALVGLDLRHAGLSPASALVPRRRPDRPAAWGAWAVAGPGRPGRATERRSRPGPPVAAGRSWSGSRQA